MKNCNVISNLIFYRIQEQEYVGNILLHCKTPSPHFQHNECIEYRHFPIKSSEAPLPSVPKRKVKSKKNIKKTLVDGPNRCY